MFEPPLPSDSGTNEIKGCAYGMWEVLSCYLLQSSMPDNVSTLYLIKRVQHTYTFLFGVSQTLESEIGVPRI